MKFASVDRRLKAIEPAPVSPSELEDIELSKILMQLFSECFPKRLVEMGCAEVVDEVKIALQTVGPRPFGHDRPDDRPVWVALDEVISRHHELVYLFRASQSMAWADVHVALGDSEDSEDVKRYREYAAEDLLRDAKEKQTTCDKCGVDLHGMAWYNGGTMEKLCRTCIGL